MTLQQPPLHHPAQNYTQTPLPPQSTTTTSSTTPTPARSTALPSPHTTLHHHYHISHQPLPSPPVPIPDPLHHQQQHCTLVPQIALPITTACTPSQIYHTASLLPAPKIAPPSNK
ncbi:Hypothetical predicted protein [Olea europaea subsp. europaea]|uniref:Uncharacterized protein n=1 Tax=Olea europaea subsp. europaea TaxID=158383 RepID=A0A8S0RFK6_OLEEU|nr:Hypothetical predicted protein [Olea europaea subsp. europaea]